MVLAIHTSDSCNTLVSLDNNNKQQLNHVQSSNNNVCSSRSCHCDTSFRRTAICLAADDDDLSFDDYDCGAATVEQPLYLPSSKSDEEVAVDKYLRNLPQIMEGCDELLSYEPQVLDNSNANMVYVHQGEVAHALSSQCDLLVSDRATTCHILALRSTSGSAAPMTSLTHLDSSSYEDCIRAMVQEHKMHHRQHAISSDVEEEKKQDDDASIMSSSMLEMDLHILGGFEDQDGSSRAISNWLMDLLARIADQEVGVIKFVLRTCAITSMNDNGLCAPMGRGMAISTRTGKCFLAQVNSDLGPAMTLRSARLWSSSSSKHKHPKLALIHTTTSSELCVAPFSFQAFHGLDQLLRLPDHLLIQYTSTSPTVEQDDFCHSVRSTLHFLQQVDCHQVFGPQCDRPLVYQRGVEQQWKLKP